MTAAVSTSRLVMLPLMQLLLSLKAAVLSTIPSGHSKNPATPHPPFGADLLDRMAWSDSVEAGACNNGR